MNQVTIVHLSDLHFSKTKDLKIWEEVVEFINNTIQPDAILISGDVTDNATESEFQIAVESLSKLRLKSSQNGQPQYRIVPGNHDRYALLGNSWFKGWRRKKHDYKATLFEKHFAGHYPTHDAVADLKLGRTDTNLWNVRIIGIDSNDPDCWFAQGAINEPTILSVAKTAKDDTESDLVIALIHHHLLPIPAIERDAVNRGSIGRLANVANVTGLLNSGVLLDHLSNAQINIVLHGHEHARHLARFSGGGPFSGTTVVLAAGSATGEKTGSKWALDRVHFNVLELAPDRSVFLREVKFDTDGLSLGNRQQLLTSASIRQSRFVRRNQKHGKQGGTLPTSRIKKLFQIDSDRSATVVESRTDTVVNKKLSLTTRCTFGNIDREANVILERYSGKTSRYAVPFVESTSKDHDAYSCGLSIEEEGPTLLKRSTVIWRWAGAVLLNITDRTLVPPSILKNLRSEERDYVALTIGHGEEYEQGSITLRIPSHLSPPPDQFRVYWGKAEDRGNFKPAEELTRTLEFCGPGHIELNIPFPTPGNCYYLSWALHSDDKASLRRKNMLTVVKSRASSLHQEAQNKLRSYSVRVAIYGHLKENVPILERLHDNTDAPHRLDLRLPRSYARSAIFGDAQVIHKETDINNEMLDDEHLLLLVPIKTFPDDGEPHPAILRVATTGDHAIKLRENSISAEVARLIEQVDMTAVHLTRLAKA